MKRLFFGAIVGLGLCLATATAADPLPKPLVTGLKNPKAIAIGADGRIYISELGEFTDQGPKKGTGRIVVIDGGKVVPFATGLDFPFGMVAFQQTIFVSDFKQIVRIDKMGKTEVFVPEKAFPIALKALLDITVDEQGNLYVGASLEDRTIGSAIFRIDPKGKVSLVVDRKKNPALPELPFLTMDGMSFLLMGDLVGGSSRLVRLKIADGSSTKVFDAAIGELIATTWDNFGRLYLANAEAIYVVPRPGEKPVMLASGFKAGPAGTQLKLDPTGKLLLVVNPEAGTVTALPIKVPNQDLDVSPLKLESAIAFPDLKWTGWKPDNKGKPTPFRPIVLTHAGDNSNRVFVATEQGVIHVFPNDQKADETKVFLDITDRVVYDDKQNEEGFLGLTFHPNYKKNGEFFVFYTSKKAKLTNIISRFHVSKDDPNKADPDSEEVLLKIEKPYWNHDGGTLCFGPDGYLYFTHGDGGLANDPQKNGQNLKTLLGKVLRIDVDHKDAGKNYAIPKDNPFVDKKDAAGEIWAYGLRNIWRMSFDRKTGVLWAGDVGQNLYEEIDLIVKGGNYGWSVREGLHPFGDDGSGVRKDLIDPIWEYSHDVGKCIIGGHVYRGSRLPELEGLYVYGDYVVGTLWALRYDEGKKRVVANRTIREKGTPMLSFGEDEKGEIYFLEESATGKGIRWLVKPKAGKQ